MKLYLPLAFAMVMIAGILLGYWLTPRDIFPDSLIPLRKNRSDKVNDIMNYVYFEYVDSVDREALSVDAINGILSGLDPHSQYISAEEFHDVNDPLIGNFEGIGIEFRMIDDSVTVVWSIEGGPSYAAGILPGDRIVTVGDSGIAGKGFSNLDVMKKLKGPRGTEVEVKVYRRGTPELLAFVLQRDVIPTFSIDSYFMTKETVGYIRLSKFSSTTVDEFNEVSSGLLKKGMKNLILDLRGNTGGYLQSAIRIADEFLEKDKMIVYTKGYNRPRSEYRATSSGSCEQVGIIILIDGRSASASEIIAGAIQDNDRGIIVGRRSYGKGLVQEQVDFADGSALRLTVARYYTPTGRCIQKPYNALENGFEDYFNESYTRYLNGELENPDSIHFNDSLKYTTPGGKVVYGGGGIMPDIYVPVRSDKRFAYYNGLVEKEMFLKFVFDYHPKYNHLFSRFGSVEEFADQDLISGAVLNDFLSYCRARNVEENKESFEFAENEIKTMLQAYFTRVRFGDQGFYPVYLKSDEIYLTALDVFLQERDTLK